MKTSLFIHSAICAALFTTALPSAFAGTNMRQTKLISKSFAASPDGKCGLKRFSLETYDLTMKDAPTEAFRSSSAIFVTETTAPECIRDYAVVQFIKGCVYEINYDVKAGKEIERYFGVVRDHRGQQITFNHPDWAVDSNEMDPLYGAHSDGTNPNIDRLRFQLVPKGKFKLKSDRASLLADFQFLDSYTTKIALKDYHQPTSILFTGDSPEMGSYLENDGKTADIHNTSLEFQTCIYHIQDIPTRGDPAFPGTPEAKGGPITCISWQDKNTFDPSTKTFSTKAFPGIDPFCATADKK